MVYEWAYGWGGGGGIVGGEISGHRVGRGGRHWRGGEGAGVGEGVQGPVAWLHQNLSSGDRLVLCPGAHI